MQIDRDLCQYIKLRMPVTARAVQDQYIHSSSLEVVKTLRRLGEPCLYKGIVIVLHRIDDGPSCRRRLQRGWPRDRPAHYG